MLRVDVSTVILLDKLHSSNRVRYIKSFGSQGLEVEVVKQVEDYVPVEEADPLPTDLGGVLVDQLHELREVPTERKS